MMASIITILAVLAVLQAFPPRVHAASTGIVCIAQVNDTKCSSPPPIFNGPLTNPSTLLRVPVMINNTASFNGFDITLNSSDVSKLKPYGVDLVGSIMPTGSITLVECVGGVLILGQSCSVTDNLSTVRVAVVGPSGFLSIPGITGLLFTAIFSISGTTAPGGITIGFQNGCAPQTSSSGTFCVSLSNGTTTPVPEATQTGGFDNSNTALLPYATLTTTTTSLGESLAGTPTHPYPTVTYTATSQNGFNTTATASLSLAGSFNGTGIRPTVLLSTALIDLTAVPRQAFTQTGTVPATEPAGVYVATVTATYQAQDLSTFTTSSLSAAFSLLVTITDYSLVLNQTTISIPSPGSKPVAVIVAPKAGFSGLVNLGVAIPADAGSAGIGATISSSTISGGSGTSILTVFKAAATPSGTFTLTISSNTTLNGFTRVHTATLIVTVGLASDFQISANPTNLAAAPFYGMASTITVMSLNGFAGPIALSFTVIPISGLTCSLSSTVIALNLTTSGTSTLSCSGTVGTYTVSITGSGGGHSHSTTVTLTVFAPGHGTVVAVDPYATIDTARTAKTIIVTVNLTNSPPINAFSVVLAYDYRVLHAASLNYSNNVLTQTPYSQVVIADCLDGLPSPAGSSGLCGARDGPGITSFAMSILGGLTLNNTTGALFKVAFSVNNTAPAFSQIQIREAVLAGGQIDPITGLPAAVPLTSTDGYYTSLSCGPAPCTPPKATFTWSPSTPIKDQTVTFDASASSPTPGATITDYFWAWGDTACCTPYTDSGTINNAAHIYTIAGTYQVTLTITEGNGVRWSKTTSVTVVTAKGFAISAPQQIIINSGQQLIFTSFVIVTSFNLTGSVTLTVMVTNPGLTVSLNPNILNITPSLSAFASLTIAASPAILPGNYSLTITATAGSITHSAIVAVAVSPGDFSLTLQPGTISMSPGSNATILVGLFTSSLNATVNLSIQIPNLAFNISFLPPSLRIFPGGSFVSYMVVTARTGIQPGNYIILVSATTGSIAHTFPLFVTITSPPDFQIQTYPPAIQVLAGSTGFLDVNVQRSPCCTNPSLPFNVTLSVTISPQVPNGPRVSLRDTFLTLYGGSYTSVIIITGPNTQPGNYTVTVTGRTGSIMHSASSIVIVLPPPVLRVTPSSGPVGTKVEIRGSGFVSQFGGYPQSHLFWVTFDDQFLGEAFTSNSSFLFTFNVPDAQPGPHFVKALDFYSGVNATAPFEVLATPSALSFTIDTGSIYFPGDTATVYVLVSQNGILIQTPSLQMRLILVKPDGSNTTLAITGVSPGLYKAIYIVPATGSIGTYALLASAQAPNLVYGSALRTFEVKPSWLASNSQAVVSATGALGTIGLVAFAWKKGYFKRKQEDEVFT